MTQNLLRKKCLKLIDEYGTTQAFIAKQCGVTRTTISYFLKDQRVLAQPIADKLENWLKSLK